MSELVKRPKEMRKAQKKLRRVYYGKKGIEKAHIHELKFLTAAIKETLRIHLPASLLFPRESSKNCVFKGYEIPAKTKVIVNAWAIGRDRKCWKEADKFNPERFIESSIDYRRENFDFIPFGAGRRICPGITFATANLLFHFDWKLPGDMKAEDLDMSELFGLTVSRKTDLELIPVFYTSMA